MGGMSAAALSAAFPVCRSLVPPASWARIALACRAAEGERALEEALHREGGALGLPPFLPELARLERTLRDVQGQSESVPAVVHRVCPNPTLRLVESPWSQLAPLLVGEPAQPQPVRSIVMFWRPEATGGVRVRQAEDADLLALKVAAEGLDAMEAAGGPGPRLAVVISALHRAAAEGVVLAPRSLLRRGRGAFGTDRVMESFSTAQTFTLQWHVTQACDLRCTHCYDRSARPAMGLADGIRVLDDLYAFCRARHVHGQVTFSGGNPLLHPNLLEFHRAARDRGFAVGVLGNPAPRRRVEELLEIGRIEFFQVSLEGLRQHNDAVRGSGHFDRTLEFLGVLRELGVYSMVMLTLTRDNLAQVLPLAEQLRGKLDGFHFNRLSPVGEGANLALPDTSAYAAFLGHYLDAMRSDPILGLKDNHFNTILLSRREPVFGGCTGHGCGAAFNFVSVLADGEVHACRKFPSFLGRVPETALATIYDSPRARRYRDGCAACTGCRLRPVCGGCLAVAHGLGLDPFRARDPFCEFPQAPGGAG